MLTHLLQKILVLRLLTGLCGNNWAQIEIAVLIYSGIVTKKQPDQFTCIFNQINKN